MDDIRKTHKDCLGRDLLNGDFVAIAQRSGNSGSMSIAIVLDCFMEETIGGEIAMIKVLGCSRNWRTGEFIVNSRPGNTFPDRIIAINDTIPQEGRKMLFDAYINYHNKRET